MCMARQLGENAWQQHKRLVADLQTYYGAELPEPEATSKTGGSTGGWLHTYERQADVPCCRPGLIDPTAQAGVEVPCSTACSLLSRAMFS